MTNVAGDGSRRDRSSEPSCGSPLSGLFTLYVTFAGSYSKTYGSLAAGVILLLWLNYTAWAILFGAETEFGARPGSRHPRCRRRARRADEARPPPVAQARSVAAKRSATCFTIASRKTLRVVVAECSLGRLERERDRDDFFPAGIGSPR